MNYGKAVYIADKFVEAIEPFCETRENGLVYAEIAGSVRRHVAEVGDIEVVCIPKMETYEVVDGLFTKFETAHHRKFVEIVDSMNILKGDAKNGKYMRRYSGKAQIQFDIFCPTKENWGNMFAVRTGSKDFSSKVLANGWVKVGYHSSDGFLYLEENMDYNEKSKKWIPKIILDENNEPKLDKNKKPIMVDPDIYLYEEIDVFNLIGMDYVEPEKRNL